MINLTQAWAAALTVYHLVYINGGLKPIVKNFWENKPKQPSTQLTDEQVKAIIKP